MTSTVTTYDNPQEVILSEAMIFVPQNTLQPPKATEYMGARVFLVFTSLTQNKVSQLRNRLRPVID